MPYGVGHLAESGALSLFALSYLLIVMAFVGTLALAWSLTPNPSHNAWPLPPRLGRPFRLAFMGLLATLGGFPPFFFLAPKLALFAGVVSSKAWGVTAFIGATALAGWYVYWQGATGLMGPAASPVAPSARLSRGGGLILAAALIGPLLVSGMLLDLWALAQWLSH